MLSYESAYKSFNLRQKDLTKHQIALHDLLNPANHPVLLARQMLLFAAALRYVPSNEVIVGLRKHHSAIIEDLAEAAIKVVTSSDALVGTLEHLVVLILEAFHHIDNGNIRRAWMTMRRAVMVSQLLGLHSPEHYRFKRIKKQGDLEPTKLW